MNQETKIMIVSAALMLFGGLLAAWYVWHVMGAFDLVVVQMEMNL